jgi:hypothetical protein
VLLGVALPATVALIVPADLAARRLSTSPASAGAGAGRDK